MLLTVKPHLYKMTEKQTNNFTFFRTRISPSDGAFSLPLTHEKRLPYILIRQFILRPMGEKYGEFAGAFFT